MKLKNYRKDEKIKTSKMKNKFLNKSSCLKTKWTILKKKN